MNESVGAGEGRTTPTTNQGRLTPTSGQGRATPTAPQTPPITIAQVLSLISDAEKLTVLVS